jgi:hypothetical protein
MSTREEFNYDEIDITKKTVNSSKNKKRREYKNGFP